MTWRTSHTKPRHSRRHSQISSWPPNLPQFEAIESLNSAQNELTEHVPSLEIPLHTFYARGAYLVEAAGDIYRKLTKYGGLDWSDGYIDEKINRLLDNTTDSQQSRLIAGRIGHEEPYNRERAAHTWDTVGLPDFLDRVSRLRALTLETPMPELLQHTLLSCLDVQQTLANFVATKASIREVQQAVEILAFNLRNLRSASIGNKDLFWQYLKIQNDRYIAEEESKQ